MYLCGHTLSSNFPTTAGAIQTTRRGSNDAFVVKLNSSGSALVYSTYLGGTGANDFALTERVDPSGNLIVGGFTSSTDFPVLSAYQPVKSAGSGFDMFITKFSPAGSILFSTFLGGNGSDFVNQITTDSGERSM
ncbi:MAG: hypothetical protein WKF37_24840 [Bryobacteraceae bacterium]